MLAVEALQEDTLLWAVIHIALIKLNFFKKRNAKMSKLNTLEWLYSVIAVHLARPLHVLKGRGI